MNIATITLKSIVQALKFFKVKNAGVAIFL